MGVHYYSYFIMQVGVPVARSFTNHRFVMTPILFKLVDQEKVVCEGSTVSGDARGYVNVRFHIIQLLHIYVRMGDWLA